MARRYAARGARLVATGDIGLFGAAAKTFVEEVQASGG
jgi:hypothetical protein